MSICTKRPQPAKMLLGKASTPLFIPEFFEKISILIKKKDEKQMILSMQHYPACTAFNCFVVLSLARLSACRLQFLLYTAGQCPFRK